MRLIGQLVLKEIYPESNGRFQLSSGSDYEKFLISGLILMLAVRSLARASLRPSDSLGLAKRSKQ